MQISTSAWILQTYVGATQCVQTQLAATRAAVRKAMKDLETVNTAQVKNSKYSYIANKHMNPLYLSIFWQNPMPFNPSPTWL